MVEEIGHIIRLCKDWVWGIPLLTLLLGTGFFLTFFLKGIQFRYLGYAFRQIFRKPAGAKGDINPYEALMTSLAGAIGTGAIVGVSSGISTGGLGALFWMWLTALVGMATKYAESLLAVRFRVVDKRGEMVGGPMEYIERGLNLRWMALLFAFFAVLAAIGTGNLVQANSIGEALFEVFDIHPLYTGIALALVSAIVLLGGVKAVGHVAGILVPVMALLYVGGGVIIILMKIEELPNVLIRIFHEAFSGPAMVQGAVGSGFLMMVQLGVSRSVFSNEAGLGISSIAAAAAKTDSPGRQAMITMTGALISTVIVCTITALVLAMTGVLGSHDAQGKLITGAPLAIQAFRSVIPFGEYVVMIGLVLFAYSTLLAWGYYGEKCVEYIAGEKTIFPYRILYCLIVIPGCLFHMQIVWDIADTMNGLMAIPNLIALVLLRKVVREETDQFLVKAKAELSNESL